MKSLRVALITVCVACGLIAFLSMVASITCLGIEMIMSNRHHSYLPEKTAGIVAGVGFLATAGFIATGIPLKILSILPKKKKLG